MAKQGDYYDEVLRRLTRARSELDTLINTPPNKREYNHQRKIRALRTELRHLTDEKYRTERGLRRRDIDLSFDDKPARKTGKTEARTGKTEVKPRTTGKVEARQTGKVEAGSTGKMEAPTGKVEARTGKVEARTGKTEAGPRATGKTTKRPKGYGRALGKDLMGSLTGLLGKAVAAEEAIDVAVDATDRQAKTVARGYPSMSMGGLPGVQITPRGPLRATSPPTVQPLFEKSRKYMPTALAQAAATAGHGSYQEIQRRYQPMMSNILQDLESRVTPMMSDEEVQGMLKRSVGEFVGRLDNLKPAGGVYRPGVSGPVPGSGMR